MNSLSMSPSPHIADVFGVHVSNFSEYYWCNFLGAACHKRRDKKCFLRLCHAAQPNHEKSTVINEEKSFPTCSSI